ncbi:MAG: Holliday junction resolvase RuvX [Pseudomonadota bacterium]|nr:MAG: Holliday junction resolvase RuvX [Pseudomonadota bacterium]
MPERAGGALLGIDFGQRTVGVALAHPMTGSARPLSPIRHRDRDTLLAQLGAVIRQWRPKCLIIGLPLAGDGGETEMSRQVRRLARDCGDRFPDLRVCLHDERLTSQAAAAQHASRRQAGRARRRDAVRLDSVAAALILESWMAEAHD